MSKMRAALAAVITAGVLTLTVLPAGAAVTRHGDVTPAITCDQFRACFWSNTDYTGSLDQEGGPAGQWQTIPVANRGSTVNKFTQSTLWLYAVTGSAAGTFQCIPAGTRKVNNDLRGRWYKDVRGASACTLIPPAPPSSIATTAVVAGGWLPYQLALRHEFRHFARELRHHLRYRMTCTGFRHGAATRAHPLRVAHITCNISELPGFMYPGAAGSTAG